MAVNETLNSKETVYSSFNQRKLRMSYVTSAKGIKSIVRIAKSPDTCERIWDRGEAIGQTSFPDVYVLKGQVASLGLFKFH